MFSMKHLLMGVYHVCSNKSPIIKQSEFNLGDKVTHKLAWEFTDIKETLKVKCVKNCWNFIIEIFKLHDFNMTYVPLMLAVITRGSDYSMHIGGFFFSDILLFDNNCELLVCKI
jgi:hypothetical protein